MQSAKLKTDGKVKTVSTKDDAEYDLAQIKARLENDATYMKRIRERTDHYFTGNVVPVNKS